jgi:hypothetical protein
MELPGDTAKVLKKIGRVRLRAEETNDRLYIRMDAATEDARHANHLRRIFDGIAALVEIGNPALAEAGLKTKIALKGDSTVTVDLSMPADEWVKLMVQEAEKKRAANAEKAAD